MAKTNFLSAYSMSHRAEKTIEHEVLSFWYFRNCRIKFVDVHNNNMICLTLPLADTNSPTTTTRSLGMLTTNPQTPIMTKTAVRPDPLQPLQILTVLAIQTVGEDLVVLAVVDVPLSVQEPCRDLVLRRVLHDGHDSFEFFGCEFSRSVNPYPKNNGLANCPSLLFPRLK